MNKTEALCHAWETLLKFTNYVVPVRNKSKKVLLAATDGDNFTLVSNDIQHFDDPPDDDDYNVAVPFLWPLFREPRYTYFRPVAGRVRDPCTDCCPKMSWESVREPNKVDAIQLAMKAAKLALDTEIETDECIRVEAVNFLAQMELFVTDDGSF